MEPVPPSPVSHLNGNWHYQFRIILLGDSTVGKSSLLRRYAEGSFIPAPCPTVGVEFYSKMMELPPGIKVKLQLWDTAGQERFRVTFPPSSHSRTHTQGYNCPGIGTALR
uniref:Uncharacterized protein n=1 Tax=Terrapene triunguis TaxID=2587831 RepID=A0A674J6W5_9SAUR